MLFPSTPEKPRIPPKVFVFLTGLGIVVYGIRGSSEWLAVLFTLGVVALMILLQSIRKDKE